MQIRADFDQLGARHLSDIAERFGLELVRAPEWAFRITTPSLFSRSYGFAYSTKFSDERDHLGRHVIDARLEGDDQILIAFDLSKPLQDQLQQATHHLEALQRERNGQTLKRPRHHRRLWPKYLRVLDARDAGETFESIYQNIELVELPAEEYDDRADRQNWAASGRQLWEQASDLMFKLTS